MTREEAIEKLNNAKGCPLLYDSHIEAIDMAIQALSQEQISLDDINNALGASFRNGVRSAKVEQEPCDDAISRILKRMWNCRGKHTTSIDKVAMEQIIRDELSVTQKSGKWINDECGNVICSECKRFRRDCRFGHTNYCNHCGAKMESEE